MIILHTNVDKSSKIGRRLHQILVLPCWDGPSLKSFFWDDSTKIFFSEISPITDCVLYETGMEHSGHAEVPRLVAMVSGDVGFHPFSMPPRGNSAQPDPDGRRSHRGLSPGDPPWPGNKRREQHMNSRRPLFSSFFHRIGFSARAL